MAAQTTVGHTGSTLVEHVLSAPRGAALLGVGFVVLISSAMVHASLSHALAALILGLSVTGLRILSRVDHNALHTPWRAVIRMTDYLTLALLCTATFGPLALVALHGEPGWDWAVLGGCLLIWWVVLDALIADHRRIIWTIAAFATAWIPVALFAPSLRTLAFLAESLALAALGITVLSLIRSLRGVPSQYRVIDVEGVHGGS